MRTRPSSSSTNIYTYVKAGMVFAATTATYFFARATGVLPSWFNWEKSETTDLTVSELATTQTMGVLSHSIFDDFSEVNLLKSTQVELAIVQPDSEERYPIKELAHYPVRQRLLQKSSVSILNPIPDQVIEMNKPYEYTLDNIFSGDYTLLSATETGQDILPSWLTLQCKLISTHFISGINVQKFAVSNNTVFLINDGIGLQILDVNNISNPILLSTYSTNSQFQDVAVSDSTVFLADYGLGLKILDVSNLSNPSLLSTYSAGTGVASGIAVSGDTVFVANGFGGLQILDISNLENLRLLSNFSNIGYARAVIVSEEIIYVAASAYGLVIMKYHDLSLPRLLYTYPAGIGSMQSVAISGNTLFVLDSIQLLILNVSKPQAPVLLSTYSLGTTQVVTSASTVFVGIEGGLHILDFSNPYKPYLLSGYFMGVLEIRLPVW